MHKLTDGGPTAADTLISKEVAPLDLIDPCPAPEPQPLSTFHLR